MDRYELSIKIEQLNKLVKKKDYESAAKIAEQIDWKKMKQWTVMSNAIEAFIAVQKYDRARNVCVYAYNRNLGGRRLLATLMDMYLKLGEYEDAEEIYGEYVETAPRDLARYTLLYKLRRAQGAPVGELIDILQEYKEKELDEAYEYELALLYSEAGLTDRCVRECDELVLWFADGDYVERALRLKQKYAPLTPRQAQNLVYLEQQSKKKTERQPAHKKRETEEPQPPYQKPVYEKPVYGRPIYQKPLKEEPQAVYEEPEAVYEEPQAVYEEPEPEAVYEEPQAVYAEPEPEAVYEEPQAVYEEPEPEAVYEEPQAVYAEPEPIKENRNDDIEYIDDIGNTTEWTPIDVEIRPKKDTVFDVEWNEPQQSRIQPKPNPKPEAKPETAPEPKAASAPQTEEDYEITIKVPDYTVYDTRNVQQELKAHVQEIMEASRNMEQKQAVLEEQHEEGKAAGKNTEKHAKSLQSSKKKEQAMVSEQEENAILPVMDSTSEPTKEIIINKRQWRKASRNARNVSTAETTVLPQIKPQPVKDVPQEEAKNQEEPKMKLSVEDLTVEQMAAILAQMEAKKAEEENNQIEGQMDITQWLRELEEETAATREKPRKEPPKGKKAGVSKAAPALQETYEAGFEEVPDTEDVPELEDISQEDEEIPDLEAAINAGIEKIIDDTVNSAVAQEKNRNDGVSYMLQPEERRFLEKYLYMSGMERKLCKYIGSSRFIKPEGTLIVGNAVIMGSRFTDKTAFAVNLFKALHAFDANREQKLAKISAQSLNNTGFNSVKNRLKGQTLIIENAGHLSGEQISQMLRFMNSETEGTLFILEDEEFNINKIFADNPDFAAKFTGRFLLKQYTVNELVDIAKDYADEQGWRIEDKALLKLYLILSQLPNDDQGSVVSKVKDIMENAGENARNRFGNKLFGRFRSVLVIRDVDLQTEGAKDGEEEPSDGYYGDSDKDHDLYNDEQSDDDYYGDEE